jgi:integrase
MVRGQFPATGRAFRVRPLSAAITVIFPRGGRDVLKEWNKEQGSESLYVFPSPRKPGKPIRRVGRAWRKALEKAGVSYFPIYNLRHVFCTRLSWVAPDAVLQRAMRHSSPETKRHYQLGMVDQVREGIERANEKAYQNQ